MRVLIVGAGALGQVFGAALAASGAHVTLLVRPGRAESARAGFALWRVRPLRRPRAQRFVPDAVIEDPAEAHADVVLLAVASEALREPWLQALARASGDATLAYIGQASGDQAAVAAAGGEQRAVFVLPGTLAWSAPLRDETPAPGIAYWLPAGGVRAVGGPPERAAEVATMLSRAGLRARPSRAATAIGQRVAYLVIPYMAALEAAGWSVAALRRHPLLPVASRAAKQAAGGRGRRGGRVVAWLVIRAAAALAPFDAEAYTRVHFTKVARQTDLMLDEWIARAEAGGRPADALRALRATR